MQPARSWLQFQWELLQGGGVCQLRHYSLYQTVANIFPFSIVGIMGKELQTSVHGFNNNGLYVGVLMLFEAASDLTVQVYGTESLSPLGAGNVLTLPCILFGVGIACTASFVAMLDRR